MRDKIQVNGIDFTLSSSPCFSLDMYRYSFYLVCVSSELSIIKKWHFGKDIFWFDPFDNYVCIEQIECDSFNSKTYTVRLTLAKVSRSERA